MLHVLIMSVWSVFDNNCVLWSVKTTFWKKDFLNPPAWFVETNEVSIFPSIAFSIKRNTPKSVNEDLYTLSQTDFCVALRCCVVFFSCRQTCISDGDGIKISPVSTSRQTGL